MKARFRLYRRDKQTKGKGGVYYLEDVETGRRTSLQTTDAMTAERLLHAHREAHLQPAINLQIARTYVVASDPAMVSRNWQEVMQSIVATKTGETKNRWDSVAKDKALALLWKKPLMETRAEHFLDALLKGTVSTNVYLRRLHNFALDMNWLLAPVLVKKKWPKPVYGEKRAITWDEHQKIIQREINPERRAFYSMAWHTGASQSDLAHLHAEDIDWSKKIISYERMKLGGRGKLPPQVSIGPALEQLLKNLPAKGYLFPYLQTVRAGDRATEFKQRCEGLNIVGVTLHSYRYSWAERAKKAGYPERWAQVNLGHNSKAMARYYSKGAELVLPSLETWKADPGKIVAVEFKSVPAGESSSTPAPSPSVEAQCQ
ncbi:tyrosine-type recombinase/integrase [Pedosphaera parvula]|uniref:Integrase family protein n=1 Tax=Pedosphaera parvula (strain Ellin514) TaxID=320771 RepID=B9XAE8_PEDPL|nr:tyrosine-type recombinase/integrase [Pedosphaera parvula]EEF62983.1 integrase family protein [Pedosphaera parvula Ellin514]